MKASEALWKRKRQAWENLNAEDHTEGGGHTEAFIEPGSPYWRKLVEFFDNALR